jgi:uncharacterized repeat protein (TIGR01451 family)
MGGVGTEIKTGSWQASALSSADGVFGFRGLGVGAAILHVSVAPGLADDLQPLIQDAGVYLNCDFPTVANIALYNELPVEVPATIEMVASSTTIEPSDEIDLTLNVSNDLPNEISNAVVTVLIPTGLTPVEVSAPVEPNAIITANANEAGELVAINLDKVASGDTVEIEISLVADSKLRRSEYTNTATLFYRESVANQASLTLSVGDDEVTRPASDQIAAPSAASGSEETPADDSSGLPSADTAGVEIGSSADRTDEAAVDEDFVPPNGLPGSGGDVPDPVVEPTFDEDFEPVPAEVRMPVRVGFVPPANLEPTIVGDKITTRDRLSYSGLNPLIPLVGLAVAGLVFATHHLLGAHRNRE